MRFHPFAPPPLPASLTDAERQSLVADAIRDRADAASTAADLAARRQAAADALAVVERECADRLAAARRALNIADAALHGHEAALAHRVAATERRLRATAPPQVDAFRVSIRAALDEILAQTMPVEPGWVAERAASSALAAALVELDEVLVTVAGERELDRTLKGIHRRLAAVLRPVKVHLPDPDDGTWMGVGGVKVPDLAPSQTAPGGTRA